MALKKAEELEVITYFLVLRNWVSVDESFRARSNIVDAPINFAIGFNPSPELEMLPGNVHSCWTQ